METSARHRRRFKRLAYVGLTSVILVSLAYGVYWASQPCTLTIHPGCGGIPDPLYVQSSAINSATNMTLQIFHGGQHSISLTSYYVKDSVGHLYSSPGWIGPTIPPMTQLNITITIDGKDFIFQPKNTYTLGFHTSQNYNVDFTITT
jgi:hypothetical protein